MAVAIANAPTGEAEAQKIFNPWQARVLPDPGKEANVAVA